MAWKYRKLLSNLANAVEALCGTTRDDAAAELAARADAEGRAVLQAAGIAVLDEAVHDAARADFTMSRLPGQEHTGGSSWQSLVRGTGSIEADHLNGEIVLLGRLHGVPTPVNAVLQRRARQAAATRSDARVRSRPTRCCASRPAERDTGGGRDTCRCRARSARAVAASARQEAEHVTLGHVQLPPCWTVNPNDVV